MRKYVLPTLFCLLCFSCLSLLASCGSNTIQKSPAGAATPKVNLGEQILAASAQKLNAAQTLYSRFTITVAGTDANGTIESEVWNARPALSRTVILQSTIPTIAETGMVTVDNGKQLWLYEPAQKVVYTGTVTTNSSNDTTSAAGQALFFSTILQTLLTRSNAALVSSSASINGHSANEIHVVPQDQATASRFDYDGYLYIDKATQLPLEADLSVQTIGKLMLEITQLDLNPPISANTFTFVVPTGVKVLPLQQANPTGGTLTLAQAQQQAGYHLLSIPHSQPGYVLQGIDALGAPGNQIYSLHYTQGTLSFTIAEGKALADLPASGQRLTVRGLSATLSTENGATTLSWTEKGVGIQITGQGLSQTQIVAIANLLA
jgi:outer membrane lipoprotein-sorting protein